MPAISKPFVKSLIIPRLTQNSCPNEIHKKNIIDLEKDHRNKQFSLYKIKFIPDGVVIEDIRRNGKRGICLEKNAFKFIIPELTDHFLFSA